MMSKIKAFLGLSYYTSELDQFFTQFDSHHKLSASQLKEKLKFQHIFDRPFAGAVDTSSKTLWKDF